MANRNLLHFSHLDAFREWLVNQGWTIVPLKGQWEVLRATKTGSKPVLIYKTSTATEHYSCAIGEISNLVRLFLREKKEEWEKKGKAKMLEIMKCGGCGGTEATLRAEKMEHCDALLALELTCKCGVVTVLRPTAPGIKQDYYAEGGELGSFCIGWNDDGS